MCVAKNTLSLFIVLKVTYPLLKRRMLEWNWHWSYFIFARLSKHWIDHNCFSCISELAAFYFIHSRDIVCLLLTDLSATLWTIISTSLLVPTNSSLVLETHKNYFYNNLYTFSEISRTFSKNNDFYLKEILHHNFFIERTIVSVWIVILTKRPQKLI